MIKIPRKTKFKKYQKGRVSSIPVTNSNLNFGKYGIKAIREGRLKANQIEACRQTTRRKMKKIGKLWICAFADIPVTSKPLETRMGKGKGSIDHWICRVRPGMILVEVDGLTEPMARSVLKAGAMKLPIKTKFVKNIL